MDEEGNKFPAKDLLEAAKHLAKNNVRKPSIITSLRRWWTDKYKLPWTPSNVGDFTVLDLLTEFYEDLFEEDKQALYEASKNEDGELVFESTGDDLIDKWEREIAMGIEPDLTEGMAPDDRYALIEEQEAARKAKDKLAEISDVDDRFNQSLKKDPMYSPKTRDQLRKDGSIPGISPLDLLGKGR